MVAVLPAGSQLPPLPHLALLALAAVLVAAVLARDRPILDEDLVLALAPWMAFGATLYVAYQVRLVPDPVAPVTSSPTVYGTVAVLAGATIAVTRHALGERDVVVAAIGTVAALLVTGVVLIDGLRRGTLGVAIPLAAVVGAGLLSGVAWAALGYADPRIPARAGLAGPLVLFAHALDGISTAFGYDVLGFGERSPLSRAIIEFAAELPVADVLGAGWLFVVVKVALALLALWLISGTMRESEEQGFALLGFVAAVGLGPGVHNVLLFAVV